MDRSLALVLTLAVGGLIAIQPPANALLSEHVGNLGAAFSSLLLSTLIVATVLVLSGDAGKLSGLAEVRPVHALGGIGGAAIVTISLIAVKELGVGGVTAALVTMQLIVALIADRLGWLGVAETPLTLERLLDAALLIAGTLLITAR